MELEQIRKTVNVGSEAFHDGSVIPEEYTADGEDMSPPLTIRNLPDGTTGVALIMDDPDAPKGTFTHWIFWNLPPESGRQQVRLGEDVDVSALGAVEGLNDFGNIGYGGPSPPSGHGAHRYRFKFFALSEDLRLSEGSTVQELERAMEGKILAWGELVGTYERS